MPDTTTNFTYVQIPLALKAISAADQQNRIKLQFIERSTANRSNGLQN